MRFKRLSASLLAVIMSIGMFSTTAFAYVDESATEEPETEEVVEVISTEPMNPLTPDGNLTLVDDEGEKTNEGKQFVTVVTKSGNYFYLIIDRDDKGEQTVHFLNQVDEADLLALMEDKEAAKYAPIVEETKPEVTPEPETEKEPVEEEVTEKKPNMLPALGTIILLIVGGGVFAFMKLKDKKKKEEQEKPDPDADYVDDEDFGYEEEETVDDDEDDSFDDEEIEEETDEPV